MIKLKKIKLNKIKNFLGKLLRSMAEHSFLTFLGLFVISLALGVFIFFRCNALIGAQTPKIGEEKSFKAEEGAYQNIKDEWDKRKEVFFQTETKTYSNPFLH